ncbi:unnamed protein product [Arabis nemorensis]|uniref:Uncharacterized protein n=1 Tax=Arabis nemorensis TaxID=586526 RepID=A0A565BCZ1_9BRAS|nr:unnamed protein product [Arabis nemorensis]
MNGNHKESLSSQKFQNSTVSWNSFDLDTERTSNVVSSGNTGVALDPNFAEKNDDDVDDGWEFKTVEAMFQSADGGYKIKLYADLVLMCFCIIGGTKYNKFKFKHLELTCKWNIDGWEFKVAEAGEPKNDLTNKESNGWGIGFGFELVSKIETTNSFQPNFEKEPQKRENGSISFPSNANTNSEGTSLAFKQPSLETEKEKEVMYLTSNANVNSV